MVLLLGLGLQAMARNRMQAASVGGAAVVATIDSALTAAQPAPNDTSSANFERLRGLVAQKRDTELATRNAVRPWFYALLLGGGLVLAALVTGAQSLFAHLRGDA